MKVGKKLALMVVYYLVLVFYRANVLLLVKCYDNKMVKSPG